MHEKNRQSSLVSCNGSSKVLLLLGDLKKTPTGKILFRQVERILGDAEYTQDRITRAYASLALVLIDTYRRHVPKDSLLYLELKLIQQRLMPPVSIAELASLQAYIKTATKLINELGPPDEDILHEALSPLLGDSMPDHSVEHIRPDRKHQVAIRDCETDNSRPVCIESSDNDFPYHKLDQQRQDMLQLQHKLSSTLEQAGDSYISFGSTLESTIQKLRLLDNPADINRAREDMLHEMETLLAGQSSLVTVLHDANLLLQELGSNSQRLNDELDQVRVLSMTDDLTRLPNRRAFIRRLEDEISRSQRERTPLTLALLDLDHFKAINDRHGHNVGDEILQLFARDILSIFRHYDMVARYGGEEFAVLLPNTSREGALRALTKVKHKAANTWYRNTVANISMPSFSAGVAVHQPGESAKQFIERADTALYRAKQGGRNRVEFDHSPQLQETVSTHESLV
ncbi:MAG: GGDEF domain-containing protein [Gammaproteobacteria bacterium]|nr:GGDEF domain-containing protein [Gammaproteobacteria bacterium]MDH5651713.1 GGDEF domain-containing protein [Gammaproteobacteria bacterium]